MKIIKLLLLLSLILGIGSHANAQLKGWVLPIRKLNTSSLTATPYLDFSSGHAVLTEKPFDGPASVQAVGNAEYCNNCAETNTKISEIIIHGLSNLTYPGGAPTGSIGEHPIGIRYEESCGAGAGGIRQEALLRNSNGDFLTHTSLTEISMGNGPTPGTFWFVSQVSNTRPYSAADYQVMLFDPNSTNVYTTAMVNNVIPIGEGNGEGFTEGVALGTEFVYQAIGNNFIPGLVGSTCRSIYIATNDARLVHLILDVNNFTILFGSSHIYNAGQVNNGLTLGIETSFPDPNNNNHARYVANSGKDGVFVSEVNGNGDFLSGAVSTSLQPNVNGSGDIVIANYNVEFDQTSSYLYFGEGDTTNRWISRYPLSSFGNNSTSEFVANFNSSSPRVVFFESAANNNIYVSEYQIPGSFTASIDEIVNPQLTSIDNVEVHEIVSDPGNLQKLSLGFPDWVDGEAPLESSGKQVEVCINGLCTNKEQYQVQILQGNQVLETITLFDDNCHSFYVCPGVSYNIRIDGDVVNQITMLTDDYSYEYNPYGVVNQVSGLINTDTYWSDTVYITGDVIVDNTVLDVTNTDVLFDECTSISFINGASIRANNSVFRTCDPNHVWNGLNFNDSAIEQNVINKCTFKNAWRATAFDNNSGANLHGNLFVNCSFGIYNFTGQYTPRSDFEGSVTDNNYILNDQFSTASSCRLNSVCYFIQSHGDFNSTVSGNAISDASNSAELRYGIELKGTKHAEIKNNTILNSKHAVWVRGDSPNSSTSIANVNGNVILNDQIGLLTGINIQSYKTTSVKNNTISNLLEPETSGNGIQIVYSRKFEIESNTVTGCKTGILGHLCFDGQIINNILNSSNNYGIYVKEPVHVNISCNEIDMDGYSGEEGSNAGIRYDAGAITNTDRINSNCILNTYNAIYLDNNDKTNPVLPEIRNNFLYNYSAYGIYSKMFTGSIGTSTSPGMNTFFSNNVAFDVYSETNIIFANNNFSLGTPSPNVFIQQNTETYSTTSCAVTIFGENNQNNYTSELVCSNQSFLDNPTTIRMGEFVAFEKTPMKYEPGQVLGSVIINTSFKVYPVPAKNTLHVNISLDNEVFEGALVIYDLMGKEISSAAVNYVSGSTAYPIQDLEEGMYLLVLRKNTGDILHKARFVKSNY
ncbi:right-handed parallel beta-helix repeat-containing protein [Aquimarina sp. RZ0]|uniref:right-handed parallel beta-helix repeat-containing protein n=1 Tax=Aquimarina sp. RZ0 TaxID=2607730 RepID=UPI0011F150FE|nr:right-handed parallel beta-helix repeat-containing protein [Aquimarina sp. RZ0]KAA1245045.1 hypothetical protein F0000_13625 [Aquimarina sp. RZ0]